jgi:hypothetical protein
MTESNYYSLELNKSNRITRIFQLVFGVICAIIAIAWAIVNINMLKSNGTLWITIILLLGFAYFQIISGLGKAEKFIEISQGAIKLKKNSLLPVLEMKAPDIGKIEVFPLNLVFFLRSDKKVFLRFGTTYTDIIEPVRKNIQTFCTGNNIPLEFKTEEL